MILVAAFILIASICMFVYIHLENKKYQKQYREEQEKNQDGINWNEGV